MTQTPNLPPTEPLDESERALARALRGLPAASPAPELDALVLGAARRAVHLAPHRRNRRWIVGLGTAATALLAMGVLLKMHSLGRDRVLASPESTQTPAAQNAAPFPHPAISASTPTPARLNTPPPKAIPPPAFPANALQAAPRKVQPPPMSPVVMETPTPMTTPAPPPPPPLAPAVENSAQAVAPARDEALRQSAGAPAAATAMQERTANPSAPPATVQGDHPVSGGALGKAEKSRSASLLAQPGLHPPADDAQLGSAEWLARIRERLASGDRAGAAASLHAFQRAHPDLPVPDDLRVLLH